MRARFAATLFATTCLAFGALACSVIAGIETFSSPNVETALEGGGVDADIPDVRTPILPLDACSCDASAASVCYAGDCYPKEIANGLSSPETVAVVGNWVVWNEPGGATANGAIRGCATDGPPCGSAPTTVSNLSQYLPRLAPPGVQTNGTLVEFESDRPNDGSGTPSTISEITPPKAMTQIASVGSGEGAIVSAAASSTWIVFTTAHSLVAKTRANGDLRSISNDTTTKITKIALNGSLLYGLFTDSPALRVIDLGTLDTPRGFTVPSPYSSVVDFVVDADRVHYIALQNESTAALVTQPSDPTREPSAPVPLPGAGRITADESRIYVTVPSAKKIFAVDKTTRALTLLYQVEASAIAVDREFLYWISGAAVLKAPKG